MHNAWTINGFYFVNLDCWFLIAESDSDEGDYHRHYRYYRHHGTRAPAIRLSYVLYNNFTFLYALIFLRPVPFTMNSKAKAEIDKCRWFHNSVDRWRRDFFIVQWDCNTVPESSNCMSCCRRRVFLVQALQNKAEQSNSTCPRVGICYAVHKSVVVADRRVDRSIGADRISIISWTRAARLRNLHTETTNYPFWGQIFAV